MIYNGSVPTSLEVVYTVPSPTPGEPSSGNIQEFNLFRVVNASAAARTVTIYLNVNGTARALTPISLQLPVGAAWDDVPVFQLPVDGVISMIASGADVVWTLNSYFIST